MLRNAVQHQRKTQMNQSNSIPCNGLMKYWVSTLVYNVIWVASLLQPSWLSSVYRHGLDAHRLWWTSSLRPVRPVHHHLTGGSTGGAEGARQDDRVSFRCMELRWSVDADGQDWPRRWQWTTQQNNNTLSDNNTFSCKIKIIIIIIMKLQSLIHNNAKPQKNQSK